MYLPKLFKTDDFNVLRDIVTNNAFANLTIFNERILATRAMMLLHGTESDFFIETHIAKANPVARKLNLEQEVLCDFLGVSTYISSSWYDHVNVSTWNYEQVQIYGKVEIMTDNELFNHLSQVTQKFERTQKCPMTVDKMDKAYVESEMAGAVGYRIYPTEVKIKQKLSQNRDAANMQRIIENLAESEHEMDQLMLRKLKK
ncbi:FMN-binding negative transcriptional regulator [Flavobacterium agricola]|uniref:FMN-binding negative transcriptional regulator n=1 Tax=Flavobacterium agricola TaxID=2870839 RepID=A0ABY6M2D4_9FLAO|nr:FMN-binding negative transcriptional regulator [Flavobacterium agricola]UYW01890.1 FMN-binding negative transcriptional regulator [Flavobacterium agricola]